MHYSKTINQNNGLPGSYLRAFLVNTICVSWCFAVSAQSCPPNIDFENGSFDGWTCYYGYTFATGGKNAIILGNSGALIDHHTMYSANTGELDPYGDFPVICPNGSGHSIKLGSTERGAKAEGISYEFTIPPDDDAFTLIYHYAVVFQSPHHLEIEQPRMVIEVKNITDDSVITCGSFTFIAVGTSLPGFEVSPHQTDTTIVLFKDWTSVSVDLSGNAGKTIRLFFKTADCTWSQHFGYAYVDVDSECGGNFIGAKYCPDDSVVNVVAPYGFQGYTWYDSTLMNVLGTRQAISVPPPQSSAGATLAVKLEPYDGYGCPKTIFAILENSLKVTANAGRDTFTCNAQPVPLGVIPKPGLAYQWSPAGGLTNPRIANPLAAPNRTTTYILTASNSGGGCVTKDTVVVRASVVDSSLQVIGKPAFCAGYGDGATLMVQPEKHIQWFKDGLPIFGARETTYQVTSAGTYYAMLENNVGCQIASQEQIISIDTAKQGISYPTKYAIMNLPLDLEARQIGENVLWQPGINLNSTTSFTPTFQGVSQQSYTINIETTTGCLTVDTQLVKTVAKVEIYVPNAFTPNQDGINDFLHPTLRGVKEVRYFRIFNRSGQLLFETKSGEPGWDGSFKGLPQSTKVVVWVLSCVGLDDVEYLKKGFSLLIR